MNNKIKIIGIVLLLILAGYFIFKPSKINYFNKIDIPPTSVVNNSLNERYIDTIIHAGLNILDIDTVFIQVRKLKKDIDVFENTDLLAQIIANDNQFIIFIDDNLSRYYNIEIIAHELIHLRDYYYKDLILFDSYGVIYKDDEYQNANEIDYYDRPWEIQAIKDGRILSKQIKEKLYSK